MTFTVPETVTPKNSFPCPTCGKLSVRFYFGVCPECMEKAVKEFKSKVKEQSNVNDTMETVR